MQSVVSYPNRGNYGKSNYRGNCTGLIIKDLVTHFKPKHFVDVCVGSGTSADVCNELKTRHTGLDIHKGFDFTKNDVLTAIGGQHADFVFSHPPYFNMIDYTQEHAKHKLITQGTDISQTDNYEEFLEFSQIMLLNQREATEGKGHYATLIGDYRKNGVFKSIQADYINMMPKDELVSVVIKMQHNTMSEGITYNGNFIPIIHEYQLIWKKKCATVFSFLNTHIQNLQTQYARTWKSLVQIALMKLEGKANLSDLYEVISNIAPEKVKNNANYRAKVRQTLQQSFVAIERGTWSIKN